MKKYQIFISSTYQDLVEERSEVIKAVLEMGHIPVGMEMFSAGDEEQWKLISRQIEQADYYVLIAAHRYGSETSEKISYTEKEYDYAKECGVPILGFVLDDTASWPNDRIDTHGKKRKLNKFKAKVKSRLVHFWSTKDDLYGKVSISLMKTMNLDPRVGWVRADEVNALDTSEFTRLSHENAELREKLETAQRQLASKPNATPAEMKKAELKDVIHILADNTVNYRVRTKDEKNWESAFQTEHSLLDILNQLSAKLLQGISANDASYTLGILSLSTSKAHSLPVGVNRIESVMTDLIALDLVQISGSGKQAIYSLSKDGRALVKHLRRLVLEERIQLNTDTDTDTD